jgi:hypothetical protein
MALDCSSCARRFLQRRQPLGQVRRAFAETSLDRADYETTIADLMAGQHSDPLREVVAEISGIDHRLWMMGVVLSIIVIFPAIGVCGTIARGGWRDRLASRPPPVACADGLRAPLSV